MLTDFQKIWNKPIIKDLTIPKMSLQYLVKSSCSKIDLISECSDYKPSLLEQFCAAHLKQHGSCITVITINNVLTNNLCQRE